jgi:hypothetical protein
MKRIFYRIYYKIKELQTMLKHWTQRATQGYSDRDVWRIDYWFETIMPQMLTDLKRTKHGVPAEFIQNEDGTEKDLDEGIKAWNEVLDRMIFCFQEMGDDSCSQKNEFEDEYFKQLRKPREGKKIKDWFEPCGIDEEHGQLYRMIKGEVEPELEKNFTNRLHEIKEYKNIMQNEALDLFKKYFRNLWN